MRIDAVLACQKLEMAPLLDDLAAFHRNDPVARAHGGEAVRDDDDGAALHDLLHIVLDDALTLVIEHARRLIENQDAWIGGERARDRDPLTLPARKIGTAFLDEGVVALRHCGDELMSARELGDRHHTAARHGGV